MARGNLFVVSGPTAVGKGTICNKLCERRPDIKVSISCTTRAPRPNEIDGVHYYFVSEERFEQMIEHGELLEHAKVHGNHYGTPRERVSQMLDEGDDVILEIDVQGSRQVLSKQMHLTPIFVLPPSKQELLHRLTVRGTETEEQINIRLHNAANELKEAHHYKYLVVNDDLDQATRRLEAIIDASHAAYQENENLLHSLYKQFQEVTEL